MAGYNLSHGELNPSYFEDDEFWRVYNVIFSNKSKNAASYKFGLVKALIENLYNISSELELTFDQINLTFTKVYWNLVANNGLKQSPTGTAVESEILSLKSTNDIPDGISFDNLTDGLQLLLLKKIKPVLKRNVFGALYFDTSGKVYGFDKKTEKLWFNESAILFIKRYQRVLITLNNYHFASYLEKVNTPPDSFNIISKVKFLAKRSSLQYFLKILSAYDESYCFYCENKLSFNSSRAVHVDHFVPWSFVQSDQLWNLVLSCGTCNTSKNDKLPEWAMLYKVIHRNERLKTVNDVQVRTGFEFYIPNKLESLYTFAIDNGYDQLWKPRNA